MSQASRDPATAASQDGSFAELALRATSAGGTEAQVVFDLDDTLFLVRPRKQAIFRELAEHHAGDAHLSAALTHLAGAHIPYDVREALLTVGIDHPEHVSRLNSLFFERFFDGAYTRHDHPNAGAADYVRRLHAEGVAVVYLTGRPEEMRERTREALAVCGFPVDAPGTALVLKGRDEAHLEDAAFKGEKAYELAARAPIAAVFDNEPANLNAMYPAAPDARYFLLATDGSPNPPPLVMDARVISDFAAARAHLEASLAASPAFAAGRWDLTVSIAP